MQIYEMIKKLLAENVRLNKEVAELKCRVNHRDKTNAELAAENEQIKRELFKINPESPWFRPGWFRPGGQ